MNTNNYCIICNKSIELPLLYCDICMKNELYRLNQYFNGDNVLSKNNNIIDINKTIDRSSSIKKKKTSNIHKYKITSIITNTHKTKIKHAKNKYNKKQPICKSNIETTVSTTYPNDSSNTSNEPQNIIKRTNEVNNSSNQNLYDKYIELLKNRQNINSSDNSAKNNFTELGLTQPKSSSNLPHSLYRTSVPGLLYSPSICSYVKVVPTILSSKPFNSNSSANSSENSNTNVSSNEASNTINSEKANLQFNKEIFSNTFAPNKEGKKTIDIILNNMVNDSNNRPNSFNGFGGFGGFGSLGSLGNLFGGCGDIDYNGALNTSNSSKNVDETDNSDEKIDDSKYPYKWIGENINSIDDLIELGKSYNVDDKFRYSLDMRKLNKLVEPLTELQKMIGLKEIKHKMFEMVMYYLQNLDHKNFDMLHSIITGPPGVGKTQLINIIAKIYNRLGFLKSDNVIFAKREDFVAGYLGQTAIKTKKLLEKSIGGVLVLDEAYSLGDSSMDGKDTFGREAINTITPFLSEHTHDFAMILAGYKSDIEKLLMTQNPGLERRFPDINRFNISGYNTTELQQIFKNTIETQEWQLDVPLEQFYNLFDKNFKYFNYFGGDMLTLFTICKKVHSLRILSIADETLLNNSKKRININDIEEAIKYYLEGAKLRDKNKDNSNELFMPYMYN